MTLDELDRLREETAALEARARDTRRRLTIAQGLGVGAPGVRDPEFPCEAFLPGTPGVHGDCDTDGHYLCDECEHRATCEECGYRPSQCTCCPDAVTGRADDLRDESGGVP